MQREDSLKISCKTLLQVIKSPSANGYLVDLILSYYYNEMDAFAMEFPIKQSELILMSEKMCNIYWSIVQNHHKAHLFVKKSAKKLTDLIETNQKELLRYHTMLIRNLWAARFEKKYKHLQGII